MYTKPIEWSYNIALASGASVAIDAGLDNSGTVSIIQVVECDKLTYSVISEFIGSVIIDGSSDPTFTAYDNLLTHDFAAATLTTTYNLAPPMQGGYITILKPFIRFTLTDRATANHSYTRFYAKAWA